MDNVTRQNSALVDVNAATARNFKDQAREMDKSVAYLRLDGGIAAELGERELAKKGMKHAA